MASFFYLLQKFENKKEKNNVKKEKKVRESKKP